MSVSVSSPSTHRRGSRTVVIRFIDALQRDTLASWVDSLPGYRVAGTVSNGAALVIAGLRGVRPIPHVVGLHHALDSGSLLRLHRAGAHRLVSSQFGLAGLRAALGNEDDEVDWPTRGLSQRELEILTLISAGCSAAEVAEALDISTHTVSNHMRRIFAKLDVHSRMQAAAEMDRLGLIPDQITRPPNPVGGSSGPLRDRVSRILAGQLAGGGRVAVLVNPTESAWRAGDRRADKIVVLGDGQRDETAVADALARGARAVLAEEELDERLPAALALVGAGYLVASDEVVRGLLSGVLAPSAPPSLTPRERDIIDSVALGHSVRETAQLLGIAVKTVQSVQRQLFSKLGARNRLQALSRARELGLTGG
jgi:DNA-binding NarL/FixJ family response regulator